MRRRFALTSIVSALLALALSDGASAVVGGSDVPAGADRYVVALLDGSRSGADWQRVFCGGSLVGPRTVLTAAHCVAGRRSVEVLAGRTNLLAPGGRRVRVTAVDLPPGWSRPTFRDDVATLQLASAVPYAPADIVRPGEEALWAPGVTATVLGWGATSERQRSQTAWLQAGRVPLLSDAQCTGALEDPATQLCAGPPASRADACRVTAAGRSS